MFIVLSLPKRDTTLPDPAGAHVTKASLGGESGSCRCCFRGRVGLFLGSGFKFKICLFVFQIESKIEPKIKKSSLSHNYCKKNLYDKKMEFHL